jgi:hypothetical protein
MNASISRAIVIALSTICLAAAASAQPKTNSNDDLRYWSMTVPVVYTDGSWKQLERPFVVACDGPSDKAYSGPLASVIQVMSREGEVLRERRIANPRINLPEKGREERPLADHVELNLTVGLARGAEVVAFYESEKDQEPSLVIDLTEEIAEAAKMAEKIRPACQFNNPPVVPVGDSGKFVLVYAVEHAARVSGMSRSDIVAQMAEQGDDFSKNARRKGLLSPVALDLLDSATVER